MATLNAIGGTIDIDMTDASRVSHAAQAAPSNASQYSWTTGSGDAITAHSFDDDIAFSATLPTRGTVHAIQAFGAYTVGGLTGSLVAMTAPPNLENYWLPILEGETTIFASADASFNGAGDFLFIDAGETVTGADDLFEGAPPADPADSQFFFGDALSVQNGGVLNGAGDDINMRSRGQIAGDARSVLGRLNGGNDSITIHGPDIGYTNSSVAGDAILTSDGEAGFVPTVNGGNDFIEVLSFFGPLLGGGGTIGSIAGDVLLHNVGLTKGGDDVIDGSGNPFFFEAQGDAQRVSSGTVQGGDDLLIASTVEFSSLVGDVQLLGGGTLFAGADTLIGGNGGDVLSGDFGFDQGAVQIDAVYTGDDSLSGGAGDDFLRGQVGDDVLDGGMGNDDIAGGGNTGGAGDVAAFSSLAVAVSADLNLGFAFGQGSDSLTGIESLIGSSKGDSLGGNAEANRLEGRGGNDEIHARAGDDRVLGGDGDDKIRGLDGDDTITGGAGADNIGGGQDEDIFDYDSTGDSGTTATTRDQIAGFVQGGASGDRFDLSSIDAKEATPGDDDFNFIGTAAFTTAGQIRYHKSGGMTIIEVNTLGNSGAEMTIAINGTFNLQDTDFI